jgi:hypothetical protein
MSANCVGSLQVCRIRVAKLTPGGLPDAGSDTGYVSDAIIQAGISVELETGDDFVLKNGCGNLCQTFKDADRVKRVNVDMEFCQLDSELVGLLVGADTFYDSMENVTIGASLPSSTAVAPDGVALELWTKAWDSNQQANAALIGGDSNDVLYFRWFFPYVRFQLGSMTLQNDILRIPVSGYGQENSDMPVDGPFEDFPAAVVAAGGITTAGGWFLDDTLPEAQCGYITVPTPGS